MNVNNATDSYFVRVKGRVRGPYDLSRLRTMVDRGRLARHDEVSADGTIWRRAGECEEIFTARSVAKVRQTGERAPTQAAVPPVPDKDGPGNRAWHYTLNGTECGPVSHAEMCRLIGSGRLGSDTHVWSEGMQSWKPLSSMRPLFGSVACGAGAWLNLRRDAHERATASASGSPFAKGKA